MAELGWLLDGLLRLRLRLLMKRLTVVDVYRVSLRRLYLRLLVCIVLADGSHAQTRGTPSRLDASRVISPAGVFHPGGRWDGDGGRSGLMAACQSSYNGLRVE